MPSRRVWRAWRASYRRRHAPHGLDFPDERDWARVDAIILSAYAGD